MMKSNLHPTDAEKTEVSGQPDAGAEGSVESRKRAFLAGLAAAPAILTLRSRSAFAQQINCSVVRSIVAATSLHAGVQPTPDDLNRCREPLQQQPQDQVDSSLDTTNAPPGRSFRPRHFDDEKEKK
jgi:hypothetical protein